MAASNSDIARIFDEVADLLEIEGANPFRVRAYRNAAQTVASLGEAVAGMVAAGRDLTEIPGVGQDLAGKMVAIVETGKLPLLAELAGRTPRTLEGLLAVPGLGPKRVAALHKALGITDLEGLRQAAAAGKLQTLPGFGAKAEANILAALDRKSKSGDTGRFTLAQAEPQAEALCAHLARSAGVERVVVAGSYRRRRETVGDLDLLVTGAADSPVLQDFTRFPDVRQVTAKGPTRAAVILRTGLQVDARLVPRESCGAALHYFTGSKAHNLAVRNLGIAKGFKVNEYGVFRGEDRIAGRTEEEIYACMGLGYVEPELRENRGEIEAARAGTLPALVRVADIRGDLHAHTNYTDGRDSPREMGLAARARGYEYLAITDHSRRLAVARGLTEERLLAQLDDIDAANDGLDGVTLLKGIECDILEDGSLDLPDAVLARLDIRVCSIHSHFGLSRDRQTERLLRAMDNPLVNILAHPTGRLIGKREPYDVDLDRVMEGARERGCFLEINAQPDRLDLDDVRARRAKELGLRLAISTDAHAAGQLGLLRFGVDQARRGWLEASDVVNTLGLAALRRLLRR
ncbi:PHP domain protein [Solidesulfovibrio carbinoliphilus subsp. oakridgensis]|uniref:DNA polymerase beta n=1 Tax=Solidesulfovibrio carbinoliphilus subsp. oakridgensis TaxID=694327 RepID=G7Q6H0_9BACT|nr:DNA polymerase/3'-5' exonuclease PolX [Solidesulfovibrio carbinoliphilus]EHJ47583.1 PHP domain protein [Solidesulfovibrio carbinoliphilus subsp. oakridgensis]